MDDQAEQFVAITGATISQAECYIALCEGNVQNAVGLFFENPHLAEGMSEVTTTQHTGAADGTRQAQPISISSDDEDGNQATRTNTTAPAGQLHQAAIVESDEAMARRLQEEFYGSSGGVHGGQGAQTDNVRAPIARTTETLVGPGADWSSDEDNAESNAEMSYTRRNPHGRQPERIQGDGRHQMGGIFNQAPSSSIWNPGPQEPRGLSGEGASNGSGPIPKENMLAQLYRPPWELMYKGDWQSARDQGKDEQKWLIINIQDPSVFDCQRVNRDLWSNDTIKQTVRESFILVQYNNQDPRAADYLSYYFSEYQNPDAYPHIAIVDPRTGEQVKVWSGPPMPEPADFLMQLHEFLDRYSLEINAKNPVAKRKRPAPKVDVSRMTEDQMLEMAMANSLDKAGVSGPVQNDPDDLTRSITLPDARAPDAEPSNVSAAPVVDVEQSPFSQISSTSPHEEPANDPAATTRIQFKHRNGRVVRRFLLTDPVRRLYEWLKAEPLDGHSNEPFELIVMGKNLIDSLDTTIIEAGLKMGTVMVEYGTGDD